MREIHAPLALGGDGDRGDREIPLPRLDSREQRPDIGQHGDFALPPDPRRDSAPQIDAETLHPAAFARHDEGRDGLDEHLQGRLLSPLLPRFGACGGAGRHEHEQHQHGQNEMPHPVVPFRTCRAFPRPFPCRAGTG